MSPVDEIDPLRDLLVTITFSDRTPHAQAPNQYQDGGFVREFSLLLRGRTKLIPYFFV